MMLKDLCKKYNLYEELKNAIYLVEFEATLDCGWTIDNHEKRAIEFLKMNDNEREEYANKHAKNYVEDCMNNTYQNFIRYYDDQFSFITNKMRETKEITSSSN